MPALEIAILDYGAGNVSSVAKAFRHLGARPRLTANAGDLPHADAIVVPGVGHFERTGAIGPETRATILDAAYRGTPVLGICLGMHWMLGRSDEAPDAIGLGVFTGSCTALAAETGIKIPHIGWNALEPTHRPSRLLGGLDAPAYVYFCHTFAALHGASTTALCHHGQTFSAIVERAPFFAVQFHPEKSGATGLHILRNFMSACEEAR